VHVCGGSHFPLLLHLGKIPYLGFNKNNNFLIFKITKKNVWYIYIILRAYFHAFYSQEMVSLL